MDRTAAVKGPIVCFRFDIVELRRCCFCDDDKRDFKKKKRRTFYSWCCENVQGTASHVHKHTNYTRKISEEIHESTSLALENTQKSLNLASLSLRLV